MLTFPRPCSLDHAQDVDATLTWGGVGWGCQRSFGHVASTLHKMPMPWGGVGWGDANVHPTLHKTLMLHQLVWVGWGDDNAYSTLHKILMLRTR